MVGVRAIAANESYPGYVRTIRAEHDYAARTDDLISAIQGLSIAHSVDEIERVVTQSARRLCGADGAALTRREGDFSFCSAEDAIGPLWKGQRFPLTDCVTGWTMLHRQAVVIPDVSEDYRSCHDAFRNTFARSLVTVPIGPELHYSDDDEIRILQALADAAFVALENTSARSELERRVRERTAELEKTNAKLHLEIAERAREEEQARRLSLSDELTGLLNRRGFMLLASQELKVVQRSGRRGLVLYIDLDGLKKTNDTFGHDAGDKLIMAAADVLRHTARDSDVIGRLGGDEFAVFMQMGDIGPPIPVVVERLLDAARQAGISISVGATGTDSRRHSTLEDLLTLADETMYRGRRARRGRAAYPITG